MLPSATVELSLIEPKDPQSQALGSLERYQDCRQRLLIFILLMVLAELHLQAARGLLLSIGRTECIDASHSQWPRRRAREVPRS
jgi:hypothetical protein